MLITLDVDGRVQFTRNPEALKLVEGLGKLAITRMSEILFDEDRQRYYIKLLTGCFAQHVIYWLASGELSRLWELFYTQHSPSLVNELCLPTADGRTTMGDVYFKPVLMRTYEDAVKVEVAFIDFLREQGIAVQ